MPRRISRKPLVQKNKNIDPDASLIADGSDDRLLKKEAFLRDFDLQIERRILGMETEKKSIIADISRMFTTQKLLIKKEIRSMKIHDFISAGGDLKSLDFTEISSAVSEDVSFHDIPQEEEADVTFKAPMSSVKRSTRKRGAAPVGPSPLVKDAPLTRSRTGKGTTKKVNQTPMYAGRNKTVMETPMITPKFDPRKPLTAAREPKMGETLLSLAGSPVLQNSRDITTNGENVVSLCLSKQQTYLGGSLFEMSMSPGTLMASKDRLQEAMNAINSRLEDLDSQLSSKLNDT